MKDFRNENAKNCWLAFEKSNFQDLGLYCLYARVQDELGLYEKHDIKILHDIERENI